MSHQEIALSREEAVFVTDVISRVLTGEPMNLDTCRLSYGVYGIEHLQNAVAALRKEFHLLKLP